MTMWHSPPLLGQARCQTLDPTILNVLQWFAFSFTQTYPAHGCKGVKVGGEKQLADLLMNYTSVAESNAYLPVLDCRLLAVAELSTDHTADHADHAPRPLECQWHSFQIVLLDSI